MPSGRPHPPALREEARRRLASGASTRQVAHDLGVPHATVRTWRDRKPAVCADCGGDASSEAVRCAGCDRIFRRTDAGRAVIARWTRDSLLAAIRDWHDTYGTVPGAADWDGYTQRRDGRTNAPFLTEPGRWPSYATVIAHWGSWSAAVEAAGFGVRTGGNHNRSLFPSETAAHGRTATVAPAGDRWVAHAGPLTADFGRRRDAVTRARTALAAAGGGALEVRDADGALASIETVTP